MGLSSSKTKTTSNTQQNTNQNETGTTTPLTPDWLTEAAQDYVGRIGAFGDMDPNGFVAPASPLQQQAWQNAGSLGDWRQQTATASQMAQKAGISGANLGGAIGQHSGPVGMDQSFGRASPMAGDDPSGAGGSAWTSPPPGMQMPAKPGGTGLPGSDTTIQSGSNPLLGRVNALGGAAPIGSAGAPAGTGGQMQLPASQNAFSGAGGQQAAPIGITCQQSGPAAYQGAGMSQVGQPPRNLGQSFAFGDRQQGPAFQATAYGYDAPQLNAPGLVGGQGYSAPQLGQAGGYAAARTGNPIGASAQGYTADLMSQAPQISKTADATASSANAGNIGGYIGQFQNPYEQQVINSTLADFDNQAAQQRAALEARGAAAGAFGGSRFGIAQGQMEGDLARGRATLESGLRDQGFNAAAALAGQQAGYDQNANLFNAQNQTQNSQYNTGMESQRQAGQAGLDAQIAQANQSAYNAMGQFNAGAQNAAQMQYADLANRSAMDYAGRQDSASQYGLGLQQQRDLAQVGYYDTAARYGADSSMQAALANQGMLGQYGLAQGQLSANAGQFNAGTRGQISQYNAGANNQMSQFNAQQRDAALNRQLQAAGMLGGLANDYGAGTRADLGVMAQLGDQQRAIEQAYAMAGPAQLQLLGQLSGMTPYDILVGRQVNSNTTGQTTGTGTQISSQTPSLFSQLLQAGQAAAAFM